MTPDEWFEEEMAKLQSEHEERMRRIDRNEKLCYLMLGMVVAAGLLGPLIGWAGFAT